MIQHLKWQRSLEVLIEDKRLDFQSFYRTSINNGRFEEGTDSYSKARDQFIDELEDVIKLNAQMKLQKDGLLEFRSGKKVIVRNSVSSTTISNNDTIESTKCSINNPQDDSCSTEEPTLKKARIEERSTPAPPIPYNITIHLIDTRYSGKSTAKLSRERKARRNASNLLLQRLNDLSITRSPTEFTRSGFEVKVFFSKKRKNIDGAVYVVGSIHDFKWKIIFNKENMFVHTDTNSFYGIYDSYLNQNYYTLNLTDSSRRM